MKRIAIVILNYNGQKMLAQFLQNILTFSQDEAEVIIADNASTDNSLDWLAEHYPTLRTIILDENYGFAEGYNKALRQVEAEYYVLLNSDVEVTHHWLQPLTEFMDAHPEVCACQPKILSEANKESFEYAGAAGGLLDRYGYPFCRGRVFGTVEKDEGQYDTPAQVLWATGACLFIRSKDYWMAGGLDGRFFAHNEEIDLCWRLNRMGRQVWCIPDSQVYHVGGGTLPKGNPFKTYLNFRNNLTMLYKNLPEAELKHVLRVRRWLDWLAAAEALILQRNWKDCKAIFKARKSFYAWKHDFDQDRKNLSGSHSSDGRKPYSILWKYYIKGQKTSGEIEP